VIGNLRRLAALAAALVLAGCGSTVGASGDGGGTAQLWVTRDHGRRVLLTASVPAGLTVLQALDRKADVKTRYGGRYVQAIDGIEGSLTRRRDWFYFVNGIEPDVGATEVELRPGDVAWWDFRDWQHDMQEPVVVGAFPKPFTRGFGAARAVRVDVPLDPDLRATAVALRQLLGSGGGAGGSPNVFVLRVVSGTRGATLTASRGQANDSPVRFVLAGSRAAVAAAARALVRAPAIIRYRYTARFDEAGRVVG
jgi:hypothetical protein